MNADGEIKPVLTVDENGVVNYVMPKNEMIFYENRMLKNIEKAETDFYRKAAI